MTTIPPEQIIETMQQHPLLDESTEYGYGTAGFRFKVEHMDGIMLRVGIASAILQYELFQNTKTNTNTNQQPQQDMGVMITASHNDESYNGVKLSNPDGSMIPPHLEETLVAIVNQRDLDLFQNTHLKGFDFRSTAKFHVGYDTRSHSERLTSLFIKGAQAMGVTVINHGVLTTPMLHHIVLHSNAKAYLPASIPPCPSRAGYCQAMGSAYLELCNVVAPCAITGDRSTPLLVDCACGVGYKAVQEVLSEITIRGNLTTCKPFLVPCNEPGEGPLNTNCGSEHVQKQLKPPTWYSKTGQDAAKSYCCSVDGDADRIVFFAASSSNELGSLLDGDKIAVLIGKFFQAELSKAYGGNPKLPKVSMGVVQTAYANGASTQYLEKNLKVPVVITKTGVKHLHHAALEFDIGIYFEANGHGTVVFSQAYHEFASQAKSICPALEILPRLINPAVGDAVSDLLLVDALLQHFEWTVQDWATKLYTDLPSRQLKVQVKDRSVVQCNDNETKCLQPTTLQPALDQLMSDIPGSRTFCRASGTENVVRVYAEAPTREQADKMATIAAGLVHTHCGGVGPKSAILFFKK
ncbi:unnamed protein product [Cylindrotheca closterium]|uniref:Phosphoacetylglucosamine mutase n=1 Tax=Cylindrotheca closterium TaxID=2856 RepID=A0AAD2FP43_9STRA|nr:unnamed protein product [Cylindrotheca closterium]